MAREAMAVVLNGVPRSGKSTLAGEIASSFAGHWVQLGVDSVMASTPNDQLPGIGLRPGGERPDLEPYVLTSYKRLFTEAAEHVDNASNVVLDVGIHAGYRTELDVMGEMHRRLPRDRAVFVGVRCSLPVLRERRSATGYLSWEPDEPVPEHVLLWQHAVHADKAYDVEVDTSTMTTPECAAVVRAHLCGEQLGS